MHSTALIVFVLTYAGIAVGGVPGLALDRTGIALIGAIAMVVFGVVGEREALDSIHWPTLLLLYGLMVVSAQFRLSGFYTRVAARISSSLERPRRFLAVLMTVSAVLSAVLANDIVCLAFTPVVVVALLRRGLPPVPFLIALACASNIGSAATIIGNPQNMLIGQVGGLSFGRFFLWCLPPTALSLGAAYGILSRFVERTAPPSPGTAAAHGHWPAYDAHQSRKGLWVTVVLVALFFTEIPREWSAMTAAAVLLCSRRMSTRAVLGLVDWHLMTLFCGLFVVIRGIEITGLPDLAVSKFAEWGVAIGKPIVLTAFSTVLSNLVSNVPAVMLLTKFLDHGNHEVWYVLALSSTFAGNLITIGSIANLITIEQARAFGVEISFREHARLGIPVTLASLAALAAWIAVAA